MDLTVWSDRSNHESVGLMVRFIILNCSIKNRTKHSGECACAPATLASTTAARSEPLPPSVALRASLFLLSAFSKSPTPVRSQTHQSQARSFFLERSSSSSADSARRVRPKVLFEITTKVKLVMKSYLCSELFFIRCIGLVVKTKMCKDLLESCV
ncbi:uncharacterized protein DS421_14g473290 [Arachis hypogaea]|nr:uncharacterized protein DS421_14g473290 [Arachis hypogaea]